MNRWHPAVKPGEGGTHARGPLDGATIIDLTSGIVTSRVAGSCAAMTLARRARGVVGGAGG